MSIINKLPISNNSILPFSPCPFYLNIVGGKDIIINNKEICGISLKFEEQEGTNASTQYYKMPLKGVNYIGNREYLLSYNFFFKNTQPSITAMKNNTYTFKIIASMNIKSYSTSTKYPYVKLAGSYDIPKTTIITYGTEYYIEIIPDNSCSSYSYCCKDKDGIILSSGTGNIVYESSLLFIPIFQMGVISTNI